ncbi:MAG: hypothetical protein ABEH88_02640 [Halobacteriales archaeon]
MSRSTSWTTLTADAADYGLPKDDAGDREDEEETKYELAREIITELDTVGCDSMEIFATPG